ncbi:MAG TPA: immunoglobulin domain-containing protein, partial [Candidatus Acidoferrum sp.]|nr:immunoglobulin domain-containing protein [Candidatus Acidoferrum sp.]
DGFFDTDPTSSTVFITRYYTLGTHVIRARITDPAGAVAVSAPVAASTVPCATELSPLTRQHGFAGSDGTIEVTVGPQCNWMVENTNDWIAIVSGDFGEGPGEVIYDVHPNPLFLERSGTLLIGDERFLVRQHAIECDFSLSPANRFHGFGPGGSNFKVTTKPGCAWQVINTNTWITINSGSNGVGTGTVNYSITENRVTGRRIGHLSVGADIYTVNQWGTNCEIVLITTARAHTENSETGSVTITTANNCSWTVQNTNSWISFPGYGSLQSVTGTNTTNFTYLVSPNTTGIERSGALNINGHVFTVTQRPCSYAVAPLSRTHGYLSESGTVEITAGALCGWNVANINNWLTIESGASGAGTGIIVYRVSQNPRGETRTATFTVAGKTVTIAQGGKPCLFTISPEEFAFGEAGGTGEVFVATEPGCPWPVENVPSWITIVPGTREGPGRVTYIAAQNTGPERASTMTIAGQDYSVSQASSLRAIAAGDLVVASGKTNCFAVSLAPLGGENNMAFSLCFDTNLLRFRSAKLQAGTWAGATLTLTTNQMSQGRVGFTVALAPGVALTSGAPAMVQVCLSALTINGRVTTPISMCDVPVARRLADALGRPLPKSFSDGSATVIGLCSLAESLDADFTWRLSSATAWTCGTNVTHDGIDAAVTAAVADGAEAWFESTLVGPGTLTFWWKVSSEIDSDRLRFYVDDEEQFRISGEVDWEWRTVNIPSGSNPVRWRYSKNGDGVGGADRAWVDEIVYMPSPPAITSQPASQNVVEGSTATFNVSVTGQTPLSYQWLRNGIALSDGPLVKGARTTPLVLSNVQPAQIGLFSVIIGNSGGSVASASASLNVTPAVSLPEALDATNLTWTATGNALWIGQSVLTHDGVDAARSGAITNSQTTSIETTVSGPGTLTFWWKVSSEESNDRLMFLTNGVEQLRISDEVDWEQRTISVRPGAQALRWTYSKNGSTSAGQDRGWVDQIQFIPAPITITAQPAGQNVDLGAVAIFAVSASGAPPISYQWQRDGSDIPGATGATLTLSNVSAAAAGTYAVLVRNPTSAVLSSNAVLDVNQIVALVDAIDAPTLVWTTNGTPPWVGQTGVNHDGSDAARSGRIGNSQTNSFATTVTGPGTLSFWWKVSSETNDRLRLVINNTEQASLFGEVDWTWRQFPIAAGNQIIQWRYTKNNSAAGGQDRGWVDEIIFVPTNSAIAPTFAIHPVARTVVAPAAGNFSAIAVGSAPLNYQWLFNDSPIANGAGV